MKSKTPKLMLLMALLILPLVIIMVGSPSSAQDVVYCAGSGTDCIIKKGLIRYNAEKDKDGPSIVIEL